MKNRKNHQKKHRIPRIRGGEKMKVAVQKGQQTLESEFAPMLSPFWGWRMVARS